MNHTPVPGAVELSTRLQRTRGRSTRVFSVNSKVTQDELHTLEDAAAHDGKSVSAWAREILLAAAAEVTGPDLVLMELVATRMLVVNMLKMIGQSQPITEKDYANLAQQVQTAKRRVAGELEQLHSSKPVTKES